MVERLPEEQGVSGSTPFRSTILESEDVMMYILQVTTGKDSSVVLGVYDSYYATVTAARKFYDENLMKDYHYFYDIKELNSDPKWTNEQMAIQL